MGGRGQGHTFSKKIPRFFRFVTLTLGNFRQNWEIGLIQKKSKQEDWRIGQKNTLPTLGNSNEASPLKFHEIVLGSINKKLFVTLRVTELVV